MRASVIEHGKHDRLQHVRRRHHGEGEDRVAHERRGRELLALGNGLDQQGFGPLPMYVVAPLTTLPMLAAASFQGATPATRFEP